MYNWRPVRTDLTAYCSNLFHILIKLFTCEHAFIEHYFNIVGWYWVTRVRWNGPWGVVILTMWVSHPSSNVQIWMSCVDVSTTVPHVLSNFSDNLLDNDDEKFSIEKGEFSLPCWSTNKTLHRFSLDPSFSFRSKFLHKFPLYKFLFTNQEVFCIRRKSSSFKPTLCQHLVSQASLEKRS